MLSSRIDLSRDRMVRLAALSILTVQVARAFLYPLLARPDDLGPDGATYWGMAREVAAQGFPFPALGTYYWGALYTLTAGQIVRVLGPNLAPVRFLNAGLFVLVLVMSWRLIRTRIGRTGAWIATATLSLEDLLSFVKYVQYELLMLTLLLTGLQLFDEAGRKDAPGKAAAAGICLGLACLTQAKILGILVLVWVWMGVRGPGAYGLSRGRVLLLAGLSMVWVSGFLLFWSWRNQAMGGPFTFSTSSGGIYLFLSNNPYTGGTLTYPPPEYFTAPADLGPWERDRVHLEKGLAFIREKPEAFLALIPKKMYYLWELRRPRSLILLGLALVGAIGLGRRLVTSRVALLLAPLVVVVGLHCIYLGWGRYRFPALPGVHLLGALAIVRVLRGRPAPGGVPG